MDRKYFSAPVNLRDIKITGGFWKDKSELIRREVIPYQWKAINDAVPGAQPSYSLHNFRAAGRVLKMRRNGEWKSTVSADIFERWPDDPDHIKDEFYGFAFQDTDVYKWIEAAAYSLTQHPDPQLEQLVDETVDIICSAQEEDGYLDTFYTLSEPEKRFTNLRSFHELYCFGHLTEASVAYAQATGKKKLLDAACRFADCIIRRMGPEEGRQHGVPGHEIAEMALARLYEQTGEEKYRELGKYFIDERGQSPNYFDTESLGKLAFTDQETGRFDVIDEKTGRQLKYSYQQAHIPVREQEEAVGHAVRAVYLYSGMADYARIDGDETLKAACEKLWDSIVNRKMYITGGIGGTHIGEAFSFDYDLPDDTAYAETCASVGMVFFARRMLQMDPDSRYADIMEKELYNGVLSGIALDGKSFFYVNPLEVWPKACHLDARKAHVFPVRQKWLPCACCPPNLARLISSIGSYAATENETTLFIHQYMNMELGKKTGGETYHISVESGFPWDGHVKISVVGPYRAGSASVQEGASHEGSGRKPLTLALRIPGWCRKPVYPRWPEEVGVRQEKGYIYLSNIRGDTTLEFDFTMEPEAMQADPDVREDIGRVAFQRGPVIYCLEGVDNGSGLHEIKINPTETLSTEERQIASEKVTGLTGGGLRLHAVTEKGRSEGLLYQSYQRPEYDDVKLRFIPYYTWANRGENEMTVWVRASED